jgi:tRNA/rRNA methyltransferase
MPTLNRLHVVLVRAENPVNIGQCARAMKNFGVTKLHLVRCSPHQVQAAYAPSTQARTILDRAEVTSSLRDVLAKSALSAGFTTRSGLNRGENKNFFEWIPNILEAAATKPVYLVFGNEKNGLSNEELALCQMAITLPAHPAYTSLNLSHAVVVCLSALYSKIHPLKDTFRKPESFFPKAAEQTAFLKDLHKSLIALGYQNKPKDFQLDRVYDHFEKFFKQRLDKKDLHHFHSLLRRMLGSLSAKNELGNAKKSL